MGRREGGTVSAQWAKSGGHVVIVVLSAQLTVGLIYIIYQIVWNDSTNEPLIYHSALQLSNVC